MTNAELDVLRHAAIGKELGSRAGEHVVVDYEAAAFSDCNGGEGWQRVSAGAATGWVDNLDEHAGTVMIYGPMRTWALRFWEIRSVHWRPAKLVA